MAYNHLRLALVYNDIDSLDLGITNLNASVKYFEDLGDTTTLIYAENTLGRVLEKQSNFEAAFMHYQTAHRIAKKVGNQEEVAFTLLSMASAKLALNEPAQSLDYANQARTFAVENGYPNSLKRSYDILHKSEEKRGNYQKALSYLSQYMVLSDSLNGVEVKERVAELETKYETAKKEAEIERLSLENELQMANLAKSRNAQLAIGIGSFMTIVALAVFYTQRNKKLRAETLHAHTTSVAQIDLSNNSLLEDLVMHTTSLQSLDLTSNPNLWRVYVYDNQLSEFDLRNGNNSWITSFRAEGNDLTCISVDDVAYSETNWSSVDGAAAFSTDCSNGANDILTFSFSEQTGAATIDATNHTIEIEVATGTSLTALEPTITFSEGASISPSGAQDFTNAVTYTVTAENYDEQEWTVTVTKKELTLGVSQLQNLSVYPNPTMGVVSIDGINQPFTVQVLDLGGKEMMTSNEKELNLSDLRTGMYLLHVELADGSTKVIRISKTN